MPSNPPAIVVFVHGTWAKGARWPLVESAVTNVFGPAARIEYFNWTGNNTLNARAEASARLNDFLVGLVNEHPGAPHFVIAHSHGGNVVLHALKDNALTDAITGIVLLSTPILDCRPLANQRLAAALLHLGAVLLWVPAVFVATSVVVTSLGLDRGVFGLILLLATLGLGAFGVTRCRPSRLLPEAKRLEELLRISPNLPRRGLVIRSPSDEATLALGTAQAFSGIAKRIWSIALAARMRFFGIEDLDAELGTGDALSDYTSVFAIAITGLLVPVLLYDAWTNPEHDTGYRILATVFFGLGGLGALLGFFGAAFVLLLAAMSAALIPAFSILLWPFGVRPTLAAALLNVSAEPTPPGEWRLFQLGPRDSESVLGFRHSLTYNDSDAIEQIGKYLAGHGNRIANESSL